MKEYVINRKLLFRNEQKEFSVVLSGISGYLCTIVLRLIQFWYGPDDLITIAFLTIWKSWFSDKLNWYDMNMNYPTQVPVKNWSLVGDAMLQGIEHL